MSLLFDRLLFEKWKQVPSLVDSFNPVVFEQVKRKVFSTLASAVVFRADNVAAYFYELSKETWSFYRDFPCITPPFESTWIEWVYPKKIFSQGEYRTDEMSGCRQGCLVHRIELDKEETEKLGIKWRLEIYLFSEFAWLGGTVFGPLIVSYFSINKSGECLSFDTKGSVSVGAVGIERTDEAEEFTGLMFPFLSPAFLALSFLNCKNVAVIDNAPPHKLSRAHAKRRGQPLVTFKTLEIEPMKKTLKTEGGIDENGLKRALHICRGHFSTYGPEHPLFGKYTGTFWRPNHVRGQRSSGVVVKDYSIGAVKNPKVKP